MQQHGVPVWDTARSVAAWPGCPSLTGDASADVCVVGLGASGLAAAEWAADRGLTVVGLDAGRVAGGASGRNAGFLLGGPARFHHQMAEVWGDKRALALYRATLAELARLTAALGPEVVRAVGSIRLAGSPGDPDPDELADCRLHAAALRAAGIAVDDYDGPLGRGLFLPDDAAANPAERCIITAAALAARAGVELFEHSAASSIAPGRVATTGGTVRAGTVVVCVDGLLERMVPALAPRVRTARLHAVATEPVAPVLPCPVYARWGYDYAQQLPGGALVVGGGRDHAGGGWVGRGEIGDAPPVVVADHIAALTRRLTGDVAITHRWTGLAAFTDDGLPVCELVADGVAVAGAYNGTGNLVGPLAARAAVALAVDGTPVPWPLSAGGERLEDRAGEGGAQL